MADLWKLVRETIRTQGFITTAQITAATGLTRQAVNQHLKRLREEGRIRKVGKTRGAKYVLAGEGDHPGIHLERVYPGPGLEEDRVYEVLATEANLDRALGNRAREVFRYAFTEMLNNAIEHSGSDHIRVEIEIGEIETGFVVKDYGVGIFEKIRCARGLADEGEALTDLLKGKVTTDPEHHSGEGIFFTSRCADRMGIESHGMALRFDRRTGPRTERIPWQEGTGVRFRISRQTRRSLRDVFDRYAGADFDDALSKTEVTVRLDDFPQGGPISRSEARRLTAGLDRFRVVTLDFGGVRILGQAFADEVFRVYAREHPDTRIEVTGTDPAVGAMIAHVRSSAGEAKMRGDDSAPDRVSEPPAR